MLDAGVLGPTAGTTNPQRLSEIGTNLEMSRSTWTTDIGYFVKRRSKPRLADALPWALTAFGTVPLLTDPTFSPNFGPIGPPAGRYAITGLALASAGFIAWT